MHLNRDVGESFESSQHIVVERGTAQRNSTDDRDYRAEMTGSETPHMQVEQLIAGGLDRRPHLLLNRIGGADIEQNRARVAYQAV